MVSKLFNYCSLFASTLIQARKTPIVIMTSKNLSNRDEVLEAAISWQNSIDTKMMIELLEFRIKTAKEVNLTLPWYTVLYDWTHFYKNFHFITFLNNPVIIIPLLTVSKYRGLYLYKSNNLPFRCYHVKWN